MHKKISFLLMMIIMPIICIVGHAQAHGNHSNSSTTLAAHIAEHIEQLEFFLRQESADAELIAQQQIKTLGHLGEYKNFVESISLENDQEEFITFINQNNELLHQAVLAYDFANSLAILKNMERLIKNYERGLYKIS